LIAQRFIDYSTPSDIAWRFFLAVVTHGKQMLSALHSLPAPRFRRIKADAFGSQLRTHRAFGGISVLPPVASPPGVLATGQP